MFGSSNIQILDVSVQAVWDRLKQDPEAQLIDVRTRAEWAYVGLPDLSQLGKKVLLVEWQSFPDNRIDADFEANLSAQLPAVNAGKDTELFFICRSGGRSLSAARVMAAAGYSRCRNVAEGFEGQLDPNRQRGRISGWKVADLPWSQG